jgi:DNA-binding NarL/FixJ family response regulator
MIVETEGDVEIVAEAETGREAVQLTSQLCPEIVVMDIGMPLLNGLEATRQILKSLPTTKVLILSAHSDAEYVEQVIKAGARGYLVKQSSGEILAKAIREVHKGRTFFSPSIAKRLQERSRKSAGGIGPGKKSDQQLTSRETELLQLIAEGLANKQVAAELGISIKTVEKHRQHLMEKLNIHDIAGLTRYAIARGVIESSVQTRAA